MGGAHATDDGGVVLSSWRSEIALGVGRGRIFSGARRGTTAFEAAVPQRAGGTLTGGAGAGLHLREQRAGSKPPRYLFSGSSRAFQGRMREHYDVIVAVR